MAVSIITYTADGSTNQFSITFDYISQSHVVVKVNGATASFTFLNASTIQTNSTPTAGQKVEIRRVTPVAALVDFTDGSTLFEADLDLADTQARYVAEEAKDIADDAKTTVETNITSINTVAGLASEIAAVNSNISVIQTAATAATNAAASATAAATSATSAGTSATAATAEKTAAETAKTSAETAKTASETAKTAAETAETNAAASATSASTSASTATTQASTATTQATNAASSASTATTQASTATTQASTATSQAATATTKASQAATSATASAASATSAASAKTAAETAKTAAETAETNAETAETNAETAETNAAASATSAAGSLSSVTSQANTATTQATNAAASATTASTQASTATTQATAAANSATTATTKAAEAATSATNALNSENSAGSSATTANTHKIAAETAKTAAETAETNAETAATTAVTSSTAASASATSASGSASTATTKASEASGSASTATTKASEASTSASTATTKASEAATSATNASNSATAAQTAKTAAETAKTGAETAQTGVQTAETNAAASATAAASSASTASTQASTATTQATNAASSATAAASSASGASSSATASQTARTAAETAKTAAELAETNAETAETNAETAETNAASSATAAATSATSASNSASTATSQASTATTQASTATTKASQASTSATNAATSATSAATSATNAAGSATAAAGSASTASTQASTASTQASNATTQANTATTKASQASSSASSALTAQAAAEAARDSALAAFDNFDDKYLGSKSSAPTVDNDGNSLVAGALYFDTTAGAMQVYSGSAWLAAYASLSGALLETNNLSDVNNAANAATNLGLGTGNSPSFAGLTLNGNLVVTGTGTVDGRDIAADGTKLDTVEANATQDQTASEIRTLVESASDSNVFTDADHSKLNSVESNATQDQTASEIRTLLESASDSNVFTDADHSKLNSIEASADVTDAANVNPLVDAHINVSGASSGQYLNWNGSDYAWSSVDTSTLMPKAGGTFTGDVSHGDNVKAKFGAGNDLIIYHDSSTNKSHITESGSSHLVIQGQEIQFDNASGTSLLNMSSAQIELLHGGSSKLTTESTGIAVTGTLAATALTGNGSGLTNLPFPSDGGSITTGNNISFADNADLNFGGSQDLIISHENVGGESYNRFFTAQSMVSRFQGDYEFGHTASGSGGDVTFKGASYNVVWDRSDNALEFADNAKATFGDGALQIYSDGTTSNIAESGSGNFILSASDFYINETGGTNMFHAAASGGTTLKFQGSSKLQTVHAGVNVTGTLAATAVTGDGSGLTNLPAAPFPASGGTFTDDVTFGSGPYYAKWDDSAYAFIIDKNAKLAVGDGGSSVYDQNFMIYANTANNTYINNQVGSLNISNQGAGDIEIEAKGQFGSAKKYFLADVSSYEAQLFYNGSQKLATKSGGVDISGTLTTSELASTGSMTMDVGADLTIDVDGGDIFLADGGTQYAWLSKSLFGGFNIYVPTQDKDFTIQGNDGGTIIEALRIDMSDNGSATFKNGLYAQGGKLGRDNNDYVEFTDNTQMDVYINGSNEFRFEADGDFHADGNVIAYSSTISDERLKEDIKPITGALDKVGQLNGYTFTYKADGKQSAGVIAQEVEAVMPSAVTETTLPLKTDDGVEYKTVQYDQLHGLLIEAIKELKAEIEELKNGSAK